MNTNMERQKFDSLNVFGEQLKECSCRPMTGFFRDGCCNTGHQDMGIHTVCCEVTEEFLEFSKQAGNDLTTPRLEYGFQGLRPGDHWCLCAGRWVEAYQKGKAPKVDLHATHEETLSIISFDILKQHAIVEEK